MKKLSFKLTASTLLIVTSLVPATASAIDNTTTNHTPTKTTAPAKTGETDQQRLANLKTKGDAEITRRLGALNKLSAVINSTSKLSATDKSNLTTQINNEIAGLNALKTKLDGETDLTVARADAKAIFDDYRVYALILPKAYLLKASDTILANDDKLTAFSDKLKARLDAAKAKGKDVSALQTKLTDMNTQIANAKAIASAVNAKVSPLMPSDYNSDHGILSGQKDQLKTAHADNQAAYADAKAIVSGLKGL